MFKVKKKIINTLPIYYIHCLPVLEPSVVLADKQYGWYRKFEKRNGKANLKRHK